MTDPIPEEINNIRRAAASRLNLPKLIGAEYLTERQGAAVLHWWHTATIGLRFSSHWVGTVGVRAYHWRRAMSGADARGIEGAERITSDIAAAMTVDLALHLDWVHPGDIDDPLSYLTELDVNGQYLSAASCELGTGEPELITAPRTLDGYLSLPGYVRLAHKPDLRNLHYPWAFQRLDAGRSIAMPMAKYLCQRGTELDAAEVVIWPRHRRHLADWQRLFRNARTCLATAAHNGHIAALIALGLVKEVANVTVGGWMRSEDKNTSDLMRKDWSDQLIAEGVVRQLIAMDKAAAFGHPAVGMRRDAAWFLGHRNMEPIGLTIDKTFHPTGRDGKLGKWKRTRCVYLDAVLIAALRTGSPETVVRTLTARDRQLQGQV